MQTMGTNVVFVCFHTVPTPHLGLIELIIAVDLHCIWRGSQIEAWKLCLTSVPNYLVKGAKMIGCCHDDDDCGVVSRKEEVGL